MQARIVAQWLQRRAQMRAEAVQVRLPLESWQMMGTNYGRLSLLSASYVTEFEEMKIKLDGCLIMSGRSDVEVYYPWKSVTSRKHSSIT